MKYVPCAATSVPKVARCSPVNPPIVNKPINPNTYSIGVSNEIEPLYMVAVQLKTLMAEGTATIKLRNEKATLVYMLSPVRNIWWPQTTKLRTAIAMLEKATKLYPKILFFEKQETISLMTPIPGRIMM